MSGTPLPIATCAFDAYGTLFDFNTVHRLADELGDKATDLRDLWRAKQLQYFWQRNLVGDYLDFETVTAQALEVSLGILGMDRLGLKDRLLNLYEEFRPFPGVAGALDKVRAKGIRLVIHTNATPRIIAASLKSSGLSSLFDEIVSIDEIGLYKPHPAAYEHLVTRVNTPAEQICFVSSNGWDVHGAAHFGLHAAWINRSGLPDDTLPGDLRFTLKSLSELPPLLVRAN